MKPLLLLLLLMIIGCGFGMIYYDSQIGSLHEQIHAKDAELERYRIALGIDPPKQTEQRGAVYVTPEPCKAHTSGGDVVTLQLQDDGLWHCVEPMISGDALMIAPNGNLWACPDKSWKLRTSVNGKRQLHWCEMEKP